MESQPELPEHLVRHPGLTTLALLSGLLALLVFLPYLQFILFGVVLAYILIPIQQQAERYIRPTVAAMVVVVAALVIILVPIIYLLTIAIQQSLRVASLVENGRVDLASVESLFESAGYSVNLVALYEANQVRIASVIQGLTSQAIDLVGGVPGLLIGLSITLFVLFALLRDRKRLMSWIQWVVPIEQEILDELFEGLDELMWASVVGNVAVAAIQGVLLGVGFVIAGLPAVIFLTVATFVLTLLPLVGAFGVWVPTAIYLLAIGRPIAGAVMAMYGLLVSLSDVYLRPALIGRNDALNTATIVIGIFGGLVVFGAVGLFIGPVVLGGAKLVLDCLAREHDRESPT